MKSLEAAFASNSCRNNKREMKPKMKFPVVLLVLIISPICVQGAEESDASAEVGTRARLPCVVDPVKCGDVHSIKWYKNIHRVFVFSELAKISRSEGPLAKRSGLEYYRNHTESYLVIETVESMDEGMYKCEITYLEVREECQGVQFVDFKTLIKPDSVVISKEDGTELKNGTILGPLTEGDEILLTCKAVGGRPVPRVQWWNGTSPLLGDYLDDLDEPVDSGRSSVRISVSRGDLGVNFECRAYHPTIEGHFTKFLQLEVDVRPNRIELSGVGEHVIQGNRVVLQCVVRGARPAANVTWYNGTVELQESSSAESLQGDGTYDTVSRLEFIATRFENEQTLSCEATNEIMSSRHEEPLRESVTLEVMYPPIVTVAPGNVTVNESTDILMFCHYEANPASLKTVKWLRDEEEFELDPDHFEGGTIEQTTLLIKNSTRHDIGAYTCMLGNEVGVSQSHNSVEVSVYFKPLVNLTITPPSPVTEVDRVNITMVCQVAAGNPDTLLAVRLYLDGQLLKELPDCGDDDSLFCDMDPSKLLLQEVTRGFHGNYSCMGKNLAGWGPMSADTELVVYYPPSPANLTFSPSRVVKRGAVTLSCTVADLGRPDNTTYRWMRGGHTVVDVTTANWTVDPVTLETEANFTCAAVNLGGESEPAVVYIKVFAPPTFINRLPPYYGALMTSQSISITCRVECSPLCTITWQKNGHQLETGPHGRYYVLDSLIPPDTRTNDFESVQSTLVWNMTAWPGGVLDRLTDNANYTCLSTGNAVGSGVKSTTFFAVEYPPENLTVSNKVVNVIEGNVPEKVLCNAKAYPEPSFQWRREGDADIIIKGNALILNYPVPRRNGGNYICEAYNRHGNNTKIAYINVLYRPECGITKKEVDGKLVLVCQAHANPPEVEFSWKIKNENETIEDNIEKSGLQSLLTLETRVENFRTYLCFANNSVGMSIPCEMDVTGSVSWWARLERENLMILIAIIAGIILMVIIICVIIIIVCRRKRAADKCPNTGGPNKDPNSSPNDALLPPDPDKAFYENLPFHNMQNPPNKAHSSPRETYIF